MLLESGARDSIRRVSISQLYKAVLPFGDEKALFQIDGRSVKKVMLVANILRKTETEKQIAYTINDGTAQIVARYWRDPSEARDDFEYNPEELRFVRVVGEINQYKMTDGDRRSLILRSMEYIHDVHEIFFHAMNVITDTQTAQYGPPPIAYSEPELQPQPGPDATESEELEIRLQNYSENVPETPAKVRKARYMPPPSPNTPRPRRVPEGNAEAGPSKLPAAPLFFNAPADKELLSSKTLTEIVVLVIREGMRTLRHSHPSAAYEGLERNDIVERVLKRRHASSSQVNEAISWLKRREVYLRNYR
ncbi:hypothetical protein BT96DRAFT_530740 [Gymnopus androsaceus JB14]|uniref:Nucleic acid-binding protein n=1 Tax=Gymnopus androsaceus JB14 TaxID=1447944 RepID=A0A6A4IJ01_9AGAR|nr:hypothetical protein BT96DRAFT_530740 [Gymnopus androsaceus JB14]